MIEFCVSRYAIGLFWRLIILIRRIHPHALEYTSFGKPNPSVFKNAETVLSQLVSSLHGNLHDENHGNAGSHLLKTLYMIGDNPSVDINGARQVCLSLTSNLVSLVTLWLLLVMKQWRDICLAFQAGFPWFSILTRTGVFKGKENHAKFPADLVSDAWIPISLLRYLV